MTQILMEFRLETLRRGKNLSVGLFSLTMLIVLSSCGGGGSVMNSVDPPSPSQVPGLLISVETEEQLLESIRTGFKMALAKNTLSRALTESLSGDSQVSGGYTTTYTLEASVDEHDYVKYDGNHLFIAPTRGLDCCFRVNEAISAELASLELTAPEDLRAIRIMSTDPAVAGVSEVGNIPLDDDRTIEGFYIDANQLALINSTGWWGRWGVSYERFETWAVQSVGLQIYDVASPEEPSISWKMELEGGFVSSRKLGNLIHLVVRHTPEIEGLIYYTDNADEIANNEALIDSLVIEDVLPKVKINGVEEVMMEAANCLVVDQNHELAPEENGFPTLTLIIAVDLVNPAIVNTTCYNESTNGVYVSENAIYLTQAEYTDEDEHKTLVHRFSIVTGIDYSGSGKVDGYLSGGSNIDFRINEFQGYLRLVTTSWTGEEEDRWDHQLYLLRKSSGALEMETVSMLPNQEYPDPIGKPDEDLYGVRFLGNKLYLVTFERIDPLYVLDLTNPLDPKIAGELEVKGFSDFLHPVSDQLLLGLGADDEGLVKLELFNVEIIEAPYSLGAISLVEGADWSYSEARYDRHAFTYLGDTSADRFTVPVTLTYQEVEGGYRQEQQLHLFEITEKDNPSVASMIPVGHLSALDHPKGNWGGSRFRSVLHDDAVYYINDEFVWSALWTNPYYQTGPH